LAKEIPENYSWYKVSNPAILKGSCEVAALNEHMATTIVSRKYGIHIYVDDGRTTVEYFRPVKKISVTVSRKNPKKISKKICLRQLRSEFNRCPNCGALIPPEQYRETDICPSCDRKIYQVA
jgi:hypothetical protein